MRKSNGRALNGSFDTARQKLSMDRKIRKVSVGQSIFSDGPRDHSGIMDYSR